MNKSKLKKNPIGKDDTIFEINNINRGQLNPSQFKSKSKSKSGTKSASKSASKSKTNSGVKSGRVVRRGFNVGSDSYEKEAVGLRVIGGRFRGSKLIYSGNNRVRPMKDRVREAVFNLVGPLISGSRVIDLFGGTGALVIEGLSRGAVSGTVIEIHLPTASHLRENLCSLNLQDICQLRKTDAFFWAKNKTEHPKDDVRWVVFCSPPYSFYVERESDMLEMLDNLIESAPIGSIFVIESDNRFDFNLLPIKPNPNKIRSYPPAEIAIFTKEQN
ncbi:MAG: RsmD family RNA methyltransferase [Planctomycetaceae bacterium]|jgi:16S rRNA (guanine966-N2)-methyltransferase|nr:RsmD family RNA methyltransferase [Planctomycetaceae bacterium]